MRLSEIINIILGKNKKKLPSGNIVESKILPITFKNNDDKIIANYIADEINKNSELYKVLLEDYNAIYIGNLDENNDKTLRINHNFDKNSFKSEKKHKGCLKDSAISFLDNALDEKYNSRFSDFFVSELKENIKGNYMFVPIGGVTQADELYYNITQYSENDKLYLRNLSCLKDIDGLELLIKSKDTQDFLTKYNEKNAIKLLNWAYEFYADHSYGDFFSKNISLIEEAVQNTRYDSINEINDILYEKKEVSQDNTIPELDNENNISMDKTEIIKLSKKILESFDTSGKLGECFEKKILEEKILLFNQDEKNQVANTLGNLLETKDNLDDLVNRAYYSATLDRCVVPITNRVSDIPIVIHEFIHQYYSNNVKDENPYSSEIPSIFFEMESMFFLEKNGYSQATGVMQEQFIHRKKNDSFNNFFMLKELVHMCKVKKDGEITLENILSNDYEDIVKQKIKNNKSITRNEVDDAKKKIAQLNIKLLNLLQKNKDMIRNLTSYTVGTFLAEKYNGSNIVRKRMIELITNSEYSIQDLLNEINEDNKTEHFKGNVEETYEVG